MRWTWSLPLLLAACQGSSSTPLPPPGSTTTPSPPATTPSPPATTPPPAATPPPPSVPSPTGDAPVSCKTDADCPHLACGPCAHGDTVMRSHVSVNCFRNPCPGTSATCQNHVCVVR